MPRATRILFYGDKTWSRHLAEGLDQRYPEQVACTSLAAYGDYPPRRLIGAMLTADVVCRVGYRPSMRDLRDVAWDWIANRLPGRRSFLYWIGTDVQHLVSGVGDGSTTPADLRAVRRARNLAGATRLAEELEEIGISAEVVPFPTRMAVPQGPPAPMPAQMTALTYGSKGREAFYGLPQVIEAATELPDVAFVVMGTVSPEFAYAAPQNVTFMGWVSDASRLFDDASVVVRLIEHDGGGGTMAEGLQHARPVIYSMHEPHTIHVAFDDTDGLIEALRALREQHRAGGIPLELAGREYAIREFDPDTRFARLKSCLLDDRGAPWSHGTDDESAGPRG